VTQEAREAIGYIDFHNDGEETDDDELRKGNRRME
jgi:hypothetical protein